MAYDRVNFALEQHAAAERVLSHMENILQLLKNEQRCPMECKATEALVFARAAFVRAVLDMQYLLDAFKLRVDPHTHRPQLERCHDFLIASTKQDQYARCIELLEEGIVQTRKLAIALSDEAHNANVQYASEAVMPPMHRVPRANQEDEERALSPAL